MTHVVTEACIRCKYTDCVEVCPVDCFHESAQMLVIDPDACVDCAVCVAECPVQAIYSDTDLPQAQWRFLELNARLAPGLPAITRRKEPLPGAEHWRDAPGKLRFLDT